MQRRIFGIETEFGVTCVDQGRRKLTPDEVARHLFRRVVAWGRSSNVFLSNGSRLYLDVGSHPEYATAECDSITDAVIHEQAGERILEGLAEEAQLRLAEEGIEGQIYVFKNNTDSAGNSYGCHENYLIGRAGEFYAVSDLLIPFLISRQLVCGAGKVVVGPRGATYAVSQRAEHIWEGVSSATTRSRPIINTRDEPHADAERFRRLHVIVGDSTMSQTTTLLKLGSTDLVLRAAEAGWTIEDFTFDNPIRAIREISSDMTGRKLVRRADGRSVSGLDVQEAYFTWAQRFAVETGLTEGIHGRVLDLWGRALQAVRTENLALVEREIDWVIKWRFLQRYAAKNSLTLDDPRILQLDLAYHDINRRRGLFHRLAQRGLVTTEVPDLEVFRAKTVPPQTTRAKLRGDFIRAASAKRRDFSVDWVHLKVNDQAQRTVLCKDPFAAEDERVARLIESM
ncbi:MAG: Pup--protein ligase [Actinomycetales bacterium]|jgi:proteasome accessory factor A|nr:Pup--protein ligase [Actinomycetales bacterium]